MEEKTIIRCEQNQMKTYDYNTDVARRGAMIFVVYAHCGLLFSESTLFVGKVKIWSFVII